MRKFTLLIASLFITIGAMAQAELDGKYVTFTNVQKDGTTEFSLYVNNSGALTISTESADALGEYALFKCELLDNGKYTFFNERAGVYMIWRNGGTGGYDGGDGTMATYSATYCDWALNASTKYSGGYYIATQRGDRNEQGTLIIMKTGVFDAYSATEGWSDTFSNVFKIEEATVGQTVDVTYKFTYNGVVKEEYTYVASATVGEEFPAIMAEFPFGITATKPEGTVEASYEGQTFTIELEENLPFVAADSYENITHWYYMTIHTTVKYLYHEADQTNIPLTVATKPAAEAKYAWAFVGDPFDGYRIYNYAAGADMVLSSSTTMAGNNGGGTYPVMTALPVADGNNELWIATASTYGTNGFFLAQKGFANNRMNNRDNKLAYWTGGADAGSTFQVSRCIVPNGYYRISYDNSGTEYYLQGVASSVKGCAFTTATGAESVWYYGGGKLLSYTAGKYIKEDGNTRGLQGIGVEGGAVTIAASSRDASKYTIACTSFLHFNISGSNYFGDHCDSDGTDTAHDMILENVMSLPVTISEAGYATFYAPVAVKVPAGVTAHTVTINGEWATLSEALEVVPANTAVVLAGDADTYNFTITTAAAFEGENALEGTVAATNVTKDAYVLGYINVAEEGEEEKKEVGFYTATKNQNEGAAFLNNSHKAYLPKTTGMNAVSYSFRFGEGTTGIDEITDNREQSTVIYDLTGRRVETITEPGIYIVNGVKKLVR